MCTYVKSSSLNPRDFDKEDTVKRHLEMYSIYKDSLYEIEIPKFTRKLAKDLSTWSILYNLLKFDIYFLLLFI